MRVFFVLLMSLFFVSAGHTADKSVLQARVDQLRKTQAQLEGTPGKESLELQRRYAKRIQSLERQLGQTSMSSEYDRLKSQALANEEAFKNRDGVLSRLLPEERERKHTKSFDLSVPTEQRDALKEDVGAPLPPSLRKRTAEGDGRGVVIDGDEDTPPMPQMGKKNTSNDHMMREETANMPELTLARSGLAFPKKNAGWGEGVHPRAPLLNTVTQQMIPKARPQKPAWGAVQAGGATNDCVGWSERPQANIAEVLQPQPQPVQRGRVLNVDHVQDMDGRCSFNPSRLVDIWHQPRRR